MNGKLQAISVDYASVATPSHSPVKKTVKAAAAQGVLPSGMLAAHNGSGELIPYNRAGASPTNVLKGVLDKEIDTSVDDAAIEILHGTVNTELLKYSAAGSAVTNADLVALEAIGVFPQ